MKSIFLALLIFGLSALINTVQAQVLISEVHPNPTSGLEWVELFNAGSEAVNLAGWILEDQLTSPTTAATLNTSVAASGYVVIELPSAKLNNTVDGVTLKNPLGVIVDVMSYSSTTAGKSWHRALLELSASFSLADPTPSQPYPTPTPSLLPSPTPEPTPLASPILASSPLPIFPNLDQILPVRLMACPVSGMSEWLELEYQGEVPYSLEDWQITDQSGNTRALNGTFTEVGLQRLTWPGSLMNNSGDYLEFKAPNDIVYFAGGYDTCQTNQPLQWHQGEWDYAAASPSPQNYSLTNSAPSPSPFAVFPSNQPSPQLSINHSTVSATVPSTFHLGAQPEHPYASASAVVTVTPWQPPVRAWIGAILSAALLIAMSGYMAYDRLQTHHQALADRVWTSLGLG